MGHIFGAMPENLIVSLAVLCVALVVAYYVIEKVRPKPERIEPTASQWLTEFGELHANGGLSDEEFRTIKAILTHRLQDELKDTGQKDSSE
jgi:hypothetical protein